MRTHTAKRSEVCVTDLRDMTAADLRALWAERLGKPPPRTFSGRLLRLGLAWQMQAAREDVESAANRRSWSAVEARRSAGATQKAAISGVAPGSPTAGTRLLRCWGGETHEVFVRDEEVEWKGQSYRSLSAVARAITGSRRNGPRFFGLREEGRG